MNPDLSHVMREIERKRGIFISNRVEKRKFVRYLIENRKFSFDDLRQFLAHAFRKQLGKRFLPEIIEQMKRAGTYKPEEVAFFESVSVLVGEGKIPAAMQLLEEQGSVTQASDKPESP